MSMSFEIFPSNKKPNCHTVFKLNEKGEVYVFYHELTESGKDFWNEEL